MNTQIVLLCLLLLQGINTHAMIFDRTPLFIAERVLGIDEIAKEIIGFIDPSLNYNVELEDTKNLLKDRKDAINFSMINKRSHGIFNSMPQPMPAPILFDVVLTQVLKKYDISTKLVQTVQHQPCIIDISNGTLSLIPYIHRERSYNDRSFEQIFFIECKAKVRKGSVLEENTEKIFKLWNTNHSLIDIAAEILAPSCKQKATQEKVTMFADSFLDTYFSTEIDGQKYISMIRILLKSDCIKNIEIQARRFPCQEKDVEEYTYTMNFSFANNKVDSKMFFPLFYAKNMTLRN